MANTSSDINSTQTRASSLYTLLVFLSFLLVMIVVVLSAYLRLAGSGLGCDAWPSCYALITSQAGGTEALAAAHLVPAWATLTHRLTASTLGLLVVGIATLAWRQRKQAGQSLLLPFAVLGLTIFLAVLGYKTPSPLQPWVALSNLLGGMTMLAMLWWLGQRAVASAASKEQTYALRPWAIAGICLIFFQITLGGWVSANFAALACTGLAGCGGFPWLHGPWHESLSLFRTLPVTDGGVVISGDVGKVVHLLHRLGALLTFLYTAWLGWRAHRLGEPYRSTAMAILFFLLLQILLGMSAVAFSLPLIVVTAHNAVAALLLLATVNLAHLLTPRDCS
jgi:cytochrome c oxidase assembly protein subunit 15